MFALSCIDNLIYVFDTRTKKQSQFDRTTGEKIRGDLDIPADEVLYMAWRQVQSPSLSEKQLREKYNKGK